MIDIEKEMPITFCEASKLYPNRRGGYGVDVSTVWRHATRGVGKIRLETIKCAGSRRTSKEAVMRFFAAVTAACDARHPKDMTTNYGRPGQGLEAAERYAEEEGI